MKHGVSFTAAARALEDPRKLELIDDRFDYGEERILSLCMERARVLLVVTVMRDENVCRIIRAHPVASTTPIARIPDLMEPQAVPSNRESL